MDAALLEYEMKRKHISAKALSEYIGIDRSSFSKKMRGISEFKLSEIQKICECLSIDNPQPIFFSNEVS